MARVLLLLLALLGACEGKGTGGGIGRSGPRTSYGGGRVLSRGYTRRYFSPGLMLVATSGNSGGGSRYNCHSCTRTTAEDTMPAEMVSDVVVAEFDVQFPEGTDLGSDAEPSPLREAAEAFVEQRVAAVVAREVPSVTAADVTVADHWLAGYDNRTLMFQVYVFSGGDDALAGRVHDALRLCGDCGASGAASATANQGTQCAAEGLAIVEDTRLADCCNTSVSDHVAAFAAAFGGLEGQEAPAGVRDARIVDCGNRTLVPMRFLSEVEAFGPEEVSSAKASYPAWMWFLTAPLGLGIWVLAGWLIGRNTYHRGGIGSSPTYCGCLRSKRVMAIRLGNGQRYKVLRMAMLRERADRDSPPCGSLNPGQVVMALGQLTDDQGERVRFRGGWTSVVSSKGDELLRLLDEEEGQGGLAQRRKEAAENAEHVQKRQQAAAKRQQSRQERDGKAKKKYKLKEPPEAKLERERAELEEKGRLEEARRAREETERKLQEHERLRLREAEHAEKLERQASLEEKQRLEKELGENQRREAAAARKVEERRRAARQQAEQLAAAEALPGVPLAGTTQRSAEWSCDFCGRVNSADTENCAGCLQIMLAGNGNGGGQPGGKGKRKSKAKEPSSKFVVPAQALPGAPPSEAMQGSADWTCGLCGRVNSCDAQNCAAPGCRAGMQRMRLGGGGTGARREMRADYGLDLDLDLAGPAGPVAVPVVQAVPVAEAPVAQPEPEAELTAKPKKGKPRRKGKRRYDPDAGMVHGEGTRDGAAESLPGLVGPEP